MKIIWETHKIFDNKQIEVIPTAVRVPVFFSHSESVFIETDQPVSPQQAFQCMQSMPGLTVIEGPDFPTPTEHASNQDGVYVGRIRPGLCGPCSLNMWFVADNIRKGAALNAVQIAEHLKIRLTAPVH